MRVPDRDPGRLADMFDAANNLVFRDQGIAKTLLDATVAICCCFWRRWEIVPQRRWLLTY